MSKIDDIRNHYLPRIKNKDRNFDILDWASEESQMTRFSVLVNNVDLAGRTLLDVGCGLGDLAKFLLRQGIEPARYIGVDVLGEMLEKARLKNPCLEFVEADVFSVSAAESLARLGMNDKFDVVFCSGALNLNLGNNLEFIDQAIASMVELASEKLVFNCLHSRFPFVDEKYFSYRPEDVLAVTQKYVAPERIKLLDDYLAGDFTVICDLSKR